MNRSNLQDMQKLQQSCAHKDCCVEFGKKCQLGKKSKKLLAKKSDLINRWVDKKQWINNLIFVHVYPLVDLIMSFEIIYSSYLLIRSDFLAD